MITLLAMLAVAAVLVTFVVDARRGLFAFLAAVLLAPYLTLGTLVLRVEHVLVPGLLLLLLVKARRGALVLGGAVWAYLAWWGWLLIATLLPSPGAGTAELSWVNLYTLLRPLGVVILFSSTVLREEDAYRLTRWFVLSAIPLGALALLQLTGNDLATNLTVAAYTSPGRTPVADLLAKLGVIVRAVSVFESPTYAGSYFLLAAACGGRLLLSPPAGEPGRRTPLLAATIVAVLGGIATLTATFLAGSILVSFLLLAVARGRARLGLLVAGGTLLLVLAALIVHTFSGPDVASGTLAYELERVRTFAVFSSRYSGSGGITIDAIGAIGERPLVGWGLSTPTGLFIGDSLYILLGYCGGLIGCLLFFVTIALAAQRGLSRPGVASIFLLWIVVLLASGFGSPSMFIPRLQDWWWAMVGLMGSPPLVSRAPSTERP